MFNIDKCTLDVGIVDLLADKDDCGIELLRWRYIS
jgi:hypothetical protein